MALMRQPLSKHQKQNLFLLNLILMLQLAFLILSQQVIYPLLFLAVNFWFMFYYSM